MAAFTCTAAMDQPDTDDTGVSFHGVTVLNVSRTDHDVSFYAIVAHRQTVARTHHVVLAQSCLKWIKYVYVQRLL